MENQEKLDQFAMAALAALISKMPILDREGTQGKETSDEELQVIRKEITKSAYAYAEWMMIARLDSKEWLKENAGLL